MEDVAISWRPFGRGGFYPKEGPRYFDRDSETGKALIERIKCLARDLMEHPATRPYLEKAELCFFSEGTLLTLRCTKCQSPPCSCSDKRDRIEGLHVALYNDQGLCKLFDFHGVAVDLGNY